MSNGETPNWKDLIIERSAHPSCAVVKSGDDLTLDLFERSASEEGATSAAPESCGARFRPLEKGRR